MKKILISIVLFLFCLTSFTTYGQTESTRRFNHPGAIISNGNIENIKKHITAADEPWKSEWNALLNAYGNANYVASGNTEIGGSGGNRQRACRDALAAMYNAVIWRATGSTKNANCAAAILSAWGNTCVSAKDELFQFPCLDMCIAAECLRNEDGTFYKGWKETDRDNFLKMVRNVFVPALRGQALNRLPSWSAPAIAGLMAAGILLDDEAIYEEALHDVMDDKGTKSGNIYNAVRANGQIWEMGRDNVHAMLCVDDLVRMAQMAWNQGDDLWAAGDHRILKGVDYWCRYNSGYVDTPWEVIPSAENGAYRWFFVSLHNNGFRLRPDGANYELAFHHYKEVLQMDESNYPYLSSFTKLARPEVNYHTLIYAQNIETSPLTTEKPGKPEGVKVVSCNGFNTISWIHPVTNDQRDYYVYRSLDGKNWSEIYHATYHTGNSIDDYGVENGCTYFYKVQFENYAGRGEMSDVCSCEVKAQDNALPEGWQVASISGKIPAEATYSPLNHGSFNLKGGGREIYYGDDGCGFLYYKMKGDGCITVRIISGTGYQQGLMMRQSLSQGARMAALKLGGKGGRYLEMWNRVNPNDGKVNMLLGSDYTHIPCWMRLERKGNKFISYISRDGKVWNTVANQILTMGNGEYYAGIFVCNDKNSAGGALSIRVDNVTVENAEQQKPQAPSALVAEAKSSSRINLSWEAVDGAKSYTIFRYDPNTKSEILIAEGLDSTSFSDSHLLSSTTYRYAVLSENMSGMSKDTAFVQQTTLQRSLPIKPIVQAEQNTLTSVKVKWNSQDEATSYKLYRALGQDENLELIAENIQDTIYVDTKLKQNNTYSYRIQAVNELAEVNSDIISVAVNSYPRLSGIFNVEGNNMVVDLGKTTRGKCHFIILKCINNQSWKLLNAKIQVAKSKGFEEPVEIGSIDELMNNNTSVGFSTEIPNEYYRYLRIVTNYSDINKSNYTLQCYGDSIRLRSQKITFDNLPEKCVGDDDFDAGATATSELPITYSSSDENVAIITETGLIHLVGIGQCMITANQLGDDTIWGEAYSVSRKLVVSANSTGVKSIQANERDESDETAYDLTGRKVSTNGYQNLPKGVYIYKGNKIIVR